MNINQWFAFWRAHPSAPETRQLAILRWQFNIAAFAVFFMMVRVDYLWREHRVALFFTVPLGLFALLIGRRYVKLKRAADKAYWDSLTDTSPRHVDDDGDAA